MLLMGMAFFAKSKGLRNLVPLAQCRNLQPTAALAATDKHEQRKFHPAELRHNRSRPQPCSVSPSRNAAVASWYSVMARAGSDALAASASEYLANPRL